MKTYAKLFLLLLFPLLLLVGWYFLAPMTDWAEDFPARADLSVLVPDTSATDTLPGAEAQQLAEVKQVDSTAQRILFFGDSMVEGLKGPMAKYATGAGHEITSVVWYSSNTHLWADTDTLQHFLREVNPTYVFVCLGSNQLFVRDLPVVDKNIATIVEKLGTIPFIWISPPNWKDDTGINELIIKHVGADRYFDSRHLTLARKSDHAHPTVAAAGIWCDTICAWLATLEPRHPLLMQKSDSLRSGSSPAAPRTILLQPVQ